jgi:hypothetical protein
MLLVIAIIHTFPSNKSPFYFAAGVSSQHARNSETAYWVFTEMAHFRSKAEEGLQRYGREGPCDHPDGDNGQLV